MISKTLFLFFALTLTVAMGQSDLACTNEEKSVIDSVLEPLVLCLGDAGSNPFDGNGINATEKDSMLNTRACQEFMRDVDAAVVPDCVYTIGAGTADEVQGNIKAVYTPVYDAWVAEGSLVVCTNEEVAGFVNASADCLASADTYIDGGLTDSERMKMVSDKVCQKFMNEVPVEAVADCDVAALGNLREIYAEVYGEWVEAGKPLPADHC